MKHRLDYNHRSASLHAKRTIRGLRQQAIMCSSSNVPQRCVDTKWLILETGGFVWWLSTYSFKIKDQGYYDTHKQYGHPMRSIVSGCLHMYSEVNPVHVWDEVTTGRHWK